MGNQHRQIKNDPRFQEYFEIVEEFRELCFGLKLDFKDQMSKAIIARATVITREQSISHPSHCSDNRSSSR